MSLFQVGFCLQPFFQPIGDFTRLPSPHLSDHWHCNIRLLQPHTKKSGVAKWGGRIWRAGKCFSLCVCVTGCLLGYRLAAQPKRTVSKDNTDKESLVKMIPIDFGAK